MVELAESKFSQEVNLVKETKMSEEINPKQESITLVMSKEQAMKLLKLLSHTYVIPEDQRSIYDIHHTLSTALIASSSGK